MLQPARVAHARPNPSHRLNLGPWLYLAPAMLWFALFAVFPLIYTLNVSVSDWSAADHPFVGFKHYAEMLGDNALRLSVRNTVIFSASTLVCSFLLGLGVALLLASDDLWGKAFFRSVLILPYVISPVVVGVAFRLMMHPILGVLNYVLGTTGRDWLGSPQSAMSSVIAITVWELTPFFAIILLAGLLSLPREPYEAARLDGAGDVQLFRHLTLPLLRPVCQVALLMGVVDVLKVFAIIYATTDGGPARLTEVIGLYIWRTGFRFYRLDYAAAMAMVLVAVISLLAWVMMRALSERREQPA
ncbi:MAG: sugar ABC transporter permease [Chloroflexi bacterium]|nr:sugar ABC transporter permease [Chloroflexota bacterium]